MSRLEQAFSEVHYLDGLCERNTFLNRRHPAINLFLTICFLIVVVSFDKYQISMLLAAGIILMIQFEMADLKISEFFYHVRAVLPLLLLVGVMNPVLDRSVIAMAGEISITGGMISMCTMLIKGLFCLASAYLLIAVTGMEKICYALRIFHVPKIIVTVIMLIYRYLILLLKETSSLTLAYSLRAPSEKGIHYRTWGTLAGQLLLRSIDRAQEVFESMCLRGFEGEFFVKDHIRVTAADVIYFVAGVISILCIWKIPIFELVERTVFG